MRPVPGAFINTPAAARTTAQGNDPVRRRLFSDANPPSTSSGQLTAGGAAAGSTAGDHNAGLPAARSADSLTKLPQVSQSSPVAKAARAINMVLQADGNFPDLDSYLRPGASSDYDLSPSIHPQLPFRKPRLVATTSELILLGVAAETTPKGTRSVSLYQTKMVLPIRGADVSLIAGSANGRIFFGGGSDTDVYELYYQQEEKWFSNRCGKINHTNPGWTAVISLQNNFWPAKEPEHLTSLVVDDSRNLLYTLSSRSTIRTYHMEAPNKLNKVIDKEKNSCLREISHMINFSPLLNDRMHLVSISPISSREASKLHLMALTNTGCRLFLSATSSAAYTIGATTNAVPQSLILSGDAVTDTQSESLKTSRNGVRYAPGYFLDFVSKDSHPNADLLFVSAPETARIRNISQGSPLRYYEHGNWIELGSRVEAVGLVTKPFAAAKQPQGFGNELAVQFDDAPSEFAILTNSGVHVVRRRRLVDIFASSLRGSSGDEGADSIARKFIGLYGRVETIASALAVACGHGAGGEQKEEVALQAEHQALHALEKLMESISEGISFVLMLFDERVSDIYTRLDDGTRQGLKDLTYERLFSTAPGKDLAKVLVKAIVNRNIESGSNVETVADALRRRCGSFCSPDDVVIFKAQEQLKRASEQPVGSNTARGLLQESLSLFERVASNLSYGNLVVAVEEYTKMRYYAGAIRLCLTVAHGKDRGNAALAWVNDGRPANDQRAGAFQERKLCYDLVHQVLQQLDREVGHEPDMIDGKPTLTATKRLEAYDVVNGSNDELFHFGLYQWYIDQGWMDRILAIESPHVVTFLESLAREDATHANLLCRFYTHQGQYYQAAVVQSDLAQADLPINIKERINLLSLAKTNANVSSPGVARQQQQVLNHKISELLEIAHIQDDVLERLRVDSRIDPQRLIEIEDKLDGKIQNLTETNSQTQKLFNDYADQAGYYDLCLLIYHAADYRNPTTIAETWTNLIQLEHEEAQEAAGMSDVCLMSLVIFPIPTLLPEVCRYACVNGQDATIGADPAWPVQLFLAVGVSHDMIIRVLEHVFDTQDYGFTGTARRTRLVELIAYVVDSWAKEIRRRGASAKGTGLMSPGLVDLIERCERALPPAPGGNNLGGADLPELRRIVKTLKREVSSLVERMGTGSLRFA
ncbi:unnamed protein product [Parascedosporium putredinis]|uniref:Nucleoporin Nup157/170 n=1 Tax=Parascedosporium putredinis TaxID=1442378 RepID=A0A9P1M9P1_9PEZI|nr:unnamed protein product [Parascedosporium putredinis]CAI7995177.1 unnamed protein product [Parascedosporium putredinis]